MTTTADEQRSNRRTQEAGLLETVVRENFLALLGTPSEAHRIQVKCLWGDCYRVNVFVTDGVGAFRVAHSHFLQADGNGKILSSNPPIKRAY